MVRIRLLAAVAALAVGACSAAALSAPDSPAGATGATTRLTIEGAASLKGVLDRAATVYEAAHPGTSLTISTDSSATLEIQIEQGAPADVFLSADVTNPRKLVDRGLADGAPVAFARNELAIIVPTANPAAIRTPADLAKPGVKIIAAGDAVPISGYAGQLVANLAREPGYPVGFAAACAANVASKEDNVKAVVAKVELGEGDAGIVYVTDATSSTKVATIDIPEAANVAATYAGVVVKGTAHPDAARAFLAWFAGPDGQAILAGSGFLPPS